MSNSILLMSGWFLVVTATAVLLRYRLLLHHCDRQLLKVTSETGNHLHDELQNRMTLVDCWGVCLTIGIVLYTILLLVRLLYQSLEKVAQALLHLLSYI